MAKKRRVRRGEPRRKRFYAPERYNQKTLREEREYGLYWYSWLWRVLRPVAVFVCATLIIIGVVSMGWNKVYETYLMPMEPESNEIVRFTIDSGTSITKIGSNLEKAGLLRNGSVFKYLVQFQGLTSNISYGTYSLSPGMSVTEVVSELTSGNQNTERIITIIPGWTVEDIADYLYDEGAIVTREEFLELCRDATAFADASYPLKLAQDAGTLAGRKYQLEGYLAPDTYRVFYSADAQSILNTLIAQTNTVVDDVFYSDHTQYAVDSEGNYYQVEQYATDLTMDQSIILASMIEKEAGKTADYAKVSAVFHNRLKAGWKLESDPTATYVSGETRLALTEQDIAGQNAYNTYSIDGLPIGPICNPSAAAMEAALFPDMEYIRQGYMYFCAREPLSGELAFSITLEEHERNVAQYRPLWEEYDRQQAAQNAQQ